MASKQKLSPVARKAKAARDLAYAKTPDRRKKKVRENGGELVERVKMLVA